MISAGFPGGWDTGVEWGCAAGAGWKGGRVCAPGRRAVCRRRPFPALWLTAPTAETSCSITCNSASYNKGQYSPDDRCCGQLRCP